VVEVIVTPLSGVNFAPGEFSPFPTAMFPQLPAVGDFNGDGKVDLIVLTQGGLEVWLGDGIGGFVPVQQTPLESTIGGQTVAVGDFDGDGKLDLAVPNAESEGSVAILLGDGKGGFTAANGSPFPAGNPVQAVVADFNLDGKPDLAISSNLPSGGVIILLGDGMGGFTPSHPVSIAEAFGLAVGDFNGDGKPDLVVVNNSDPGTVTILLGDGTGGFQPSAASPFPVGTDPYFVVVGDFNLDGKLDIATANFGSSFVKGNVSVLLGDGTGGFTAPGSPLLAGDHPLSLTLGDFNGDGHPDLAVADFSDSRLTVLLGDGNGGFAPASYSPLPVGASPLVVSGDFNGDGVIDLATANYGERGVSVVLGTTGLTISVSQGTGFAVNQTGIYSFTVTNLGTTASTGQVTVMDTLPSGLRPQTTIANGWNCSIDGQTITCTREDSLPAGQAYPEIVILLLVTPAACPNALNIAKVFHRGQAVASASTPISGCLNVIQQSSNLVVGRSGFYTLNLQSPLGAINNTDVATVALPNVSITVAMPTGLTPVSVDAAAYWACSFTQNVVYCSAPQLPLENNYERISLNFLVDSDACPTATDVVQLQINGSPQAIKQFSNDVSGCLTVQPSRLDFKSSTLGASSVMTVTVTSTGVGQQAVKPLITSESIPSAFSVSTTNCPDFLSRNNTCQITVTSLYPCFGAQIADLSIWTGTNDSVVYTIPLTATGLPNTVSLALNGSPLPATSTISPDQSYTTSLTLNPAPPAGCMQTAALKPLSFLPSAPDNSSWDASLKDNTLKTGTVAGTITLQAEIGGTNIAALDGSGRFTLNIPPQAGVVKSATIINRTDSSFEIVVTGYSTPRNINPDGTINPAKTPKVCFSFAPAGGATLQTTSQYCQLQEDIEIWYERSISYASGSQFQGAVTVSLSGAAKAIGQVKVWIVNEMGMSAPSCVDFQSGASVSCQ
jgi:uncharacterized repeat protein (TIGR01451 family)